MKKLTTIFAAVMFTTSAIAAPEHLPPTDGVPILCSLHTSICDMFGVCLPTIITDCPPRSF